MSSTPVPARPPRSIRSVAFLVVGAVGLALLGVEGLRRIASAGGAEPFDPADLATLSPPDALELALFAALAAARLGAAFLPGRHRRLLPLVDLPLLGLVVAVSGGTLSPLDPTLALVYVTALLFRRGAETGRTPRRRIAIELLLGLVALDSVVLRHDRLRLANGTADETRRVAATIDAARSDNAVALSTIHVPSTAAVATAGTPEADRTAGAAYAEMVDRLRAAQDAIAHFLDRLGATRSTREIGEAKQELEEKLDDLHDRYFDARSRWRQLAPASTASDVDQLDLLRETQWNVRQDLLVRMDDVEQLLARRDRMMERQGEFLRDAMLRRLALAVSLLLFAWFAIALRDRLAAAVRESEERRARRDVEASQQETDHWIAVTAGLTHGLGNDILAYDVWLREIERALGGVAQVPEKVRERLRLLVDSNRGRLGFLQFLDAFARQRQHAAGDAPPPATEPVELVALLEKVRRNLAQVEIADLPPEGSDAAVDRQIRKLRDLALTIRCEDPAAGRLASGQRGLIEFVAYELLKNALRSATGGRPLVARLDRSANGVALSLENDVQVELSEGTCPSCGRAGRLRRVQRRRDAAAACDACFGKALQRLLDESFAPGKGSGTGLGLFLIRYFLSTFWHGAVRATVVDEAVPLVRFTVELPDAGRAAGTTPRTP
jgi:hypothetical protein